MAQEQWNQIFRSKAKELQFKDTWNLEFDDNIVANSPPAGWHKCVKNTSARFRCNTCIRQWPSNKVMVVFHMRLENGTGTVKVRRLGQSCNWCKNEIMVSPDIEDDNVNDLLDDLMVEIRIQCYEEHIVRERTNARRLYEVNNCHEPLRCEGCRVGICH